MNAQLLIAIIDRLNILIWAQSKDGQKNRNRPKPILEEILNTKEKKNSKYKVFKNGKEFMQEWRRLTHG